MLGQYLVKLLWATVYWDVNITWRYITVILLLLLHSSHICNSSQAFNYCFCFPFNDSWWCWLVIPEPQSVWLQLPCYCKKEVHCLVSTLFSHSIFFLLFAFFFICKFFYFSFANYLKNNSFVITLQFSCLFFLWCSMVKDVCITLWFLAVQNELHKMKVRTWTILLKSSSAPGSPENEGSFYINNPCHRSITFLLHCLYPKNAQISFYNVTITMISIMVCPHFIFMYITSLLH